MDQRLEDLNLLRGDLLRVEWVDIAEDPVGNPANAQLARRTSYGLFWGLQQSHEVSCLVTTTTVDLDVADQSGYVIYPIACVRKITVIKRARRPRAPKRKRSSGQPAAPPEPGHTPPDGS